jgi:hypothetical protein
MAIAVLPRNAPISHLAFFPAPPRTDFLSKISTATTILRAKFLCAAQLQNVFGENSFAVEHREATRRFPKQTNFTFDDLAVADMKLKKREVKRSSLRYVLKFLDDDCQRNGGAFLRERFNDCKTATALQSLPAGFARFTPYPRFFYPKTAQKKPFPRVQKLPI